MDSYDIRFWDIKKIGSGTAARYRVRWAVNGREHCKSFKARPLADGFLTGLKDAVRDRRPFDPRTGLPEAEVTEDEVVTWYAHARAYTEAKWAQPRPGLAPVGRRGPGHRHHRPQQEGAGRPRAEGAAAGAVRLGVQPRHPRHHPAAPHRRRPRLGRARLAPGHRPGRHRDRAAGAGRLRHDPGRQAGGRVDPAAQAVGVLQRPRLRRRTRPPRLQPGRPDPVDRPRRRPERGPAGRRQPRPGRDAPDRRRAAGAAGSAPEDVLRRPLLRGAAPVGGGHAPRGRPAPAQDRVGTDRPCRPRHRGPGGPGPTRAPPARNAA